MTFSDHHKLIEHAEKVHTQPSKLVTNPSDQDVQASQTLRHMDVLSQEQKTTEVPRLQNILKGDATEDFH